MLEKTFQKIGFSTQKKQEKLCHNGIENLGYNSDEENFNNMAKGKFFTYISSTRLKIIYYFVKIYTIINVIGDVGNRKNV